MDAVQILSPWQRIQAHGEIPSPRTKFSAVLFEQKLIVFGGGHYQTFFNDLYEYNLQTSTWTRIYANTGTQQENAVTLFSPDGGNGGVEDLPLPRRSHSAVRLDHKMFVFAGRKRTCRINDLFELDLNTYKWTKIHPSSQLLESSIAESLSRSRVGELMTAIPYFLKNVSPSILDAVNTTDSTSSNSFNSFLTSACCELDTLLTLIPQPRAAHSACIYHKEMVIFGGDSPTYDYYYNEVHAFDCEKYRWRVIPCESGYCPQGRLGHTAVVYGDSMYVFGGYGGEAILMDLHCFHFLSGSWRRIATSVSCPVDPVSFHSVVCYSDFMLVCGGCVEPTYLAVAGRASGATTSLPSSSSSTSSSSSSSNSSSSSSSSSCVSGGRSSSSSVGSTTFSSSSDSSQRQLQSLKALNLWNEKWIGLQQLSDGDTISRSWLSSPFRTYSPSPTSHRQTLEQAVLQTMVTAQSAPHSQPKLPEDEPGELLPEIHSRLGHIAVCSQNSIYCFGGSCGERYFNDLSVLRLTPVSLKYIMAKFLLKNKILL